MDATLQIGVNEMTVHNRFAVLLAEKRIQEKKRIPLADVAKATGISERTLQSWNNNEVTRFDASVIFALCCYLGCEIKDLLVMDEPCPAKE